MVYADTSFFLGLMEESDEHHSEAMKIQKRHQKNIETSLITIAELLKGCEEHGLDAETVMNSIFSISKVSGITLQETINAAHYIKEKNLKTIDAIHCALAGGQIISFDKDFDKTGIRRI
ncbi:MAG: type II toxin-antitoxin system VapC family toxin, partial [Candidatus Aenigmarchaeota archaeon]|nr:type II toxin-antitoxin system VapC family toxin [Candidatus Aenigmarchaeota archaeon]